jgi:5-methylcytosine-specific restriction endonuclease McrA|tara:strand:+ start:42 stop:335 length:294 start_codon:yes stop_codon:yes gene_type:complete
MAFTDEKVQIVWEKGTIVTGYDSFEWRKDQCDAWIKRSNYGNRDSDFGWEVDHITPQSNGGGDQLSNLRPLQWENNVATSNGRLTCNVKSNGNKNVR